MLANNDDNDDDTVVISKKAQKTAKVDNDSLAVEYTISDSANTGHFLVEGALVTNLQVADNSISITIPNGKIMTSMHTCNLDIPWLPNHVTEAHIVPGLEHASLISTRTFCEAGCNVILKFGIVMLIGLSSTCKFVTGAPSTRKWPVAPESEMAY